MHGPSKLVKWKVNRMLIPTYTLGQNWQISDREHQKK